MNDEWSIDTIVHALPFPDMRQQALRDIHLAPVDELTAVVDKWRAIAVHWATQEAPRIENALSTYEATGKLPAEYDETPEASDQFDAWRHQMQQLRQQRQAGAA
ncbi:hypothetical protein ACWDV7_20505 [Streptomyces sp. NPDC003362]